MTPGYRLIMFIGLGLAFISRIRHIGQATCTTFFFFFLGGGGLNDERMMNG